jgi:hypothetical protein
MEFSLFVVPVRFAALVIAYLKTPKHSEVVRGRAAGRARLLGRSRSPRETAAS